MSDSPAERRRFRRRVPALILGALLFGAWAAPAGAQSQDIPQQPLRLVPPATLGPTKVPAPSGGVLRAVIEAPAAIDARSSSAIEVNPLAEIAPNRSIAGQTPRQALARISADGIERLPDLR